MCDENQDMFVKIIKDYPIILDKSNLPSAKCKRNVAIGEVRVRLEKELNVMLNANQILKKFNNMKSRVKAKSDLNKTGNKKVILKPWEQELLDFIEKDFGNPAISRLKGAVTAGTSTSSVSSFVDVEDFEFDTPVEVIHVEVDSELAGSKSKNNVNPQANESVKKPCKKRKLSESEETKNLTLSELQREVLLKQLEYFDKANQYMDIKLKRARGEKDQEIDRAEPDEVVYEVVC